MSDYRTPRDTTSAMRDTAGPLGFLAASMGSRGPGGAIEEQEAAGQREIVHSDVIPARGYSEDELTALGFRLGAVVEGDPLFRRATLPDGWTREGSEYALWSHLLDELGRKRASIFYKAAFYDRDAFLSITTVRGYVSSQPYEKQPVVLDDAWATQEAVLAAVDELRAHDAEKVAFWTEHGNDEAVREYTAKVAEWNTLRATIAAQADDSDEDLSGEARCRVCGCTENSPCPGGCRWVPDPQMGDLCSACPPDTQDGGQPS